MDRNHKPLRKIILKAGTLQASAGEQVLQTDITDHDGLRLPALVDCPIDSPLKAGTLQASDREQVLQTDVHSAGHDGLSLPALVDCLQDSPRKNLVPKPPQGPRPSREANIAKAEKKATEVIKARRSREAKYGVKKLSRQVVGMLALPQTLLTQTTSYSVLPAIKKGTKVTKMDTTEPLCPLTPDGEIIISSSSVDDLLTPKSDVTSEAKSDDASRQIGPEVFSLTNFLKSHPKRKLIRNFLKQINVTIGDLDEIIEWVVCVSNEVFLPVMVLIRTSSPESSNSSRWGSGELQIISREFHQRSSEPKGRLLGGQPPTPPSETDKELQGVADLSVSNILKRAQEDLFFSVEDDLENTHPDISLTEERLSSIFSELFRDACESAQEAARRIHHMRSGRGNSSRNGRCPGLSQGSSRSNMPDLGELGSERKPKESDVHKVLSEGSLPALALLGERPGEVGETSSPAGEIDTTQTASIPRSGHGGRRSRQTTAPTTGHRETGVTASNIFDVIFHLTHSDTDRELHQEFSSEDDVSLNDITDMKLTPPVEPLGQILSSWKLVNRIFRGKVHYFGKELICKVYQMLLDTGMGRRPMARQSRSEPILKDLAANRRLSDEFFTNVLYMFIQRAIKNLLENFLDLPTTPPGRDIMWNDNFNWMYRDGWGETPTSSENELWDSDSTWSRDLGEEEGAESRGRWAALLERGSFLTLQSSSSLSLSDNNKEALGAVCQVLTTRVGDILNSTCNDDYKARLIIQKGLDSGARERFPGSPCSSSPKDEEEVVVSGTTVSYPKPSTSTQAAWAAPAQTLDGFLPRPRLDEEEVVPSTSMKDDSVTTTHAARAAPSQTLEEEVGEAEVSEMSDSSLMPTKNRQDPLEKIPSLLPGKEHILLCSTPWSTVMSPQTLKFILHGIMCRLEASESPQTRRANEPFRLMKDLFVEVQHALKYADISVVFGLEESIQFSGEDAVKAIVKTAAKRLSLRSDSNRAQLRAARSGSEGAIRCMADTITQVIDDYSEDWSSDGHFGARRSRGSGRSHSSTSSRSDVTLTEELLAWRETLEEDLEEMADDSTGLEKTSVSSAISEKSQVISYLSESTKPISSALSTDLEDITSKKKKEAMKKEVRKSGKKKRGNNKNQKKNKVSPLGNDSKSSFLYCGCR
ncbi:uncharacterized protein [Oncorhynchus clarkii lewisi]|uniref:uncharacterized protein n=1 Tax=Oncorhynchus clarkii lewisi TaxID=490388 RepID=UPI0039B856AE